MRNGGCKKSRTGYVTNAMATPSPIDGLKHDDEVWAWLETHFRQHRRQLHLFALGLLGNREDAEDATQIVLLNAYRGLVRGERPTWPRAWLFAIARNVCRRLRQQAGARRVLVAGTRELRPVERGSDALTGAELSQAFSSLPPGQREIFMLRELRGLSYAELSEQLGLSPAAAESLLARARRRLREQLAASDENRRPLIGIPGAGASLRLARAPATFKLAAFAGTAAIAPLLAVGLHALPERSSPPGLHAATPVIQPVQRALTRSPGRRSSSPGPMTRTARSRSPRALPVAARSPRPASSGPATVAPAAAASPGAAAEVVSSHSSSAGDASTGVTVGRPTKPAETTRTLPVTDTVDNAVAATQGAVDDLVAVVPVPVPDVPADAIPAVPEEVVPDPPPLVQNVQDGASSTVSDVLNRVR
jgi:RNA polymerase sigma-70 factor, ECF subfamily